MRLTTFWSVVVSLSVECRFYAKQPLCSNVIDKVKFNSFRTGGKNILLDNDAINLI